MASSRVKLTFTFSLQATVQCRDFKHDSDSYCRDYKRFSTRRVILNWLNQTLHIRINLAVGRSFKCKQNIAMQLWINKLNLNQIELKICKETIQLYLMIRTFSLHNMLWNWNIPWSLGSFLLQFCAPMSHACVPIVNFILQLILSTSMGWKSDHSLQSIRLQHSLKIF
jgi:hypothetical protein